MPLKHPIRQELYSEVLEPLGQCGEIGRPEPSHAESKMDCLQWANVGSYSIFGRMLIEVGRIRLEPGVSWLWFLWHGAFAYFAKDGVGPTVSAFFPPMARHSTRQT